MSSVGRRTTGDKNNRSRAASRDLRGRPPGRAPAWKQRHSHGLPTATWFQGRFAPRRDDDSAFNPSDLMHDGEKLPSNLGAATAPADGTTSVRS